MSVLGRTFGYRQATQRYQRRDAAYAVIIDDKQRVACVVDKRRLFLPGGGLEAGEDALQAVHREVAEECARTLEVISPLDPAVQFFRAARGQAYELRASFLRAEVAPKRGVTSNASSDSGSPPKSPARSEPSNCKP